MSKLQVVPFQGETLQTRLLHRGAYDGASLQVQLLHGPSEICMPYVELPHGRTVQRGVLQVTAVYLQPLNGNGLRARALLQAKT